MPASPHLSGYFITAYLVEVRHKFVWHGLLVVLVLLAVLKEIVSDELRHDS